MQVWVGRLLPNSTRCLRLSDTSILRIISFTNHHCVYSWEFEANFSDQMPFLQPSWYELGKRCWKLEISPTIVDIRPLQRERGNCKATITTRRPNNIATGLLQRSTWRGPEEPTRPALRCHEGCCTTYPGPPSAKSRDQRNPCEAALA